MLLHLSVLSKRLERKLPFALYLYKIFLSFFVVFLCHHCAITYGFWSTDEIASLVRMEKPFHLKRNVSGISKGKFFFSKWKTLAICVLEEVKFCLRWKWFPILLRKKFELWISWKSIWSMQEKMRFNYFIPWRRLHILWKIQS